MRSKCNFCGKKWITGKIRAPYICPDCEDKMTAGQINKKKLALFRHWQKKGMIEQ